MQSIYLVMMSLLLVNCEEYTREGRWFLGKTLSTTKTEYRIVTQKVPSSCIVAATSLEPCRGLRQLQVAPTVTNKIISTESPFLDESSLELDYLNPFRQAEESVEFRASDSSTGWQEYLGLADTTVTDVVKKEVTSVVYDPQVVVTFSIIGCQPKYLPLDLEYCKTASP